MHNVLTRSKVAIAAPSGYINAANAAAVQEQLVAEVSSQHHVAVLVDMSHVESLDSAGLMAFVSALTLAQQLEKRFSLCCVPPSIRIIFELTQLDRAFEIFENHHAFEAAIA